MLVPTRISVDTSAGEQIVDFRCARCGCAAQVSVTGGGTGLKVAGVRLSDAELDARVGAAQATRLAPCPRCGHRDRAALAKVLLSGALLGSFAGGCAWLVAAEELRRSDPGGTIAGQLGIGAFLAVVVAWTVRKLRSVRRRVRFLR